MKFPALKKEKQKVYKLPKFIGGININFVDFEKKSSGSTVLYLTVPPFSKQHFLYFNPLPQGH